MARRLLITGFDPFGGADINPAWEAVKKLPDRIGDFTLCKLQIPNVFGEAGRQVLAQAAAICAADLPGQVSNSAGAFVCNDTLYMLLHHYAGSNVSVGFIHVPWLPQQGTPSLLPEDTVRALTAAIEVC